MLSSLRSRLLLTYTLLIGVILSVVVVALILFILRNPIVDRQVFNRLEGIADLINRQGFVIPQTQDRLETLINRIDQQADVRVMILSSKGEVILDSQANEAARLNPDIHQTGQYQRGITLDSEHKAWYIVWEPLGNGNHLVLATRRIGRVSLLFTQRLGELLRDDLFPPLLQSGFIVLILALILSLLMTNWITSPLGRISEATHQVSIGKYSEVPVEGPKEVRILAQSFNEMVHTVVASQQSQKDFVVNVSHELKTPLTSIQGFAQAVIDGTIESQAEIINAANVIMTEAGRMHRMVVDLLDLARLEAGTIRMDRLSLDMDSLLSDVVEKLKPQAASGNVTLEYKKTFFPRLLGIAIV